MKLSISYYITLWVIRLKAVKKNFSKDPIDFNKIRKEDVMRPKNSFFKKNILRTFKISDSTITEVGVDKSYNKLLIFIHGGAFISGPAKHHWDTIKEIAKKTNYKIWMCNYPKAPENQILKISKNIDNIYASSLKKFKASDISLIGDSVGGTLTTALIQRLIINRFELPNRIILVSPVMDASLSHPEIEGFEKIDPMLSIIGVKSAKKMCAGNMDLKDPIISPLYGDFKGFPNTFLFLAQNDIMYPDGKLAEEKMKKNDVTIKVIEGSNMPHIWPFLPVMKEAKTSLQNIIRILNNNSNSI